MSNPNTITVSRSTYKALVQTDDVHYLEIDQLVWPMVCVTVIDDDLSGRTFGTRVAKWFDDRKITENGSLLSQLSKLREEVQEIEDSFKREPVRYIGGRQPIEILVSIDPDLFKDAIGDCAVVLAGMAHMAGMSFEECCEHAWNEIKDRTGHLNADGVFVKDE